jgi:putative hydrolase of HD superfamily
MNDTRDEPFLEPEHPRLAQQLRFICEVDQLKSILRRTLLIDESRLENSAEHSWHLAMMAIVLQEHANEPVDLGRVLRMLLIHDIVEIDAGDTYAYDTQGNLGKAERENKAADRLFGLLPEDQAGQIRELWDEFEERQTAEARFANALDRFQPMVHNYRTRGRTWQEHGVVKDQVVGRNQPMEDGSRELWRYTELFIAEAVELGWLKG